MATAKLWWNGSSWGTSEATCVNSYPGGNSDYARVRYRIWIIAYDNATIKMEASLKAVSGMGNAWISGGTKTVKSGSTTIGTGSFTADVTQYTTFSWSGNVSSAMNEYGTLTYHAGAPNNASGTINITASPFATITYDANGGTGAPGSQTVCKGVSTALSSGTPTRTGYTFLGWDTSSSATTATYTAGGAIVASADTTLYAVWQANSQSITITKPNTASVTILRNGEAFTGNTVYFDDILTITATPSPGYRITTLTVNGADFVSGSTHTVSGDVAIVADTIAQSSTIATYDSSVNTLGTFSLTVNRYNPSHYNKLRYYDSSDNLLYTSAAFTESTALTVPQSWFTDFGSVTSITIKAVLTTYTDPECTIVTGVDDICYFTVTADATMKPTLAAGVITLTPVNPGDAMNIGPGRLLNPGFVKGYSKVQAVFDTSKITHAVGASAGTYAISVQNVLTSGTGTTLLSSNTITAAGTLTITYTVTDSRGRSTSATQTISVNDYTSPAIASLSCFRCDSAQQPDDDESYMAVKATCTFTTLSNNAITITVEAKPTGGSYTSYGTLTNATQARIGGSFLPDTSYFVKVTVTDTVGNSAFTEMSMPRRSWTFHMRHSLGGPGAAFGKVTENDYALQLASGWDFMMGSTRMTETNLQDLLALSPGSYVTDVEVDNVSVVSGGVASINLTGKADASAFKAFTVTLLAASWSGNAQAVSNAYFLSSGYAYIVSPEGSSFADYAAAVIYADNVSTDGSMIFHCSNAPASDLTVNIVRVLA